MSLDKKFICKFCNKEYSSSQSRSNHYSKFHKNISKSQNVYKKEIVISNDLLSKYICGFCNKNFANRHSKWKHQQICTNQDKSKFNCRICCKNFSCKQSRWKHEKTCTEKEFKIEKDIIDKIENQINVLSTSLDKKNIVPLINTQLLNIINEKIKNIEELKLQLKDKNINNIILNNVIIFCRDKDNYINSTQLCDAGNKNFNDWYSLESTKQLIVALHNKTKISILDLIDNNENIWLHPELAIDLAHWISPIFSLEINDWIRKILNYQSILNKDKEINLKEEKIKVLQNSFIKKQERENYKQENVIYMLTTEENKKNRNYVIGKTSKLKKRLSNYNKSTDHEVVYYRKCNTKEDMDIIENMVLNKLKKYKEKVNRDRFILPIDKNISFFKNIIDECIDFISNKDLEIPNILIV